MTKQELVNKIFEELEKHHIYLYHDITKERFEKEKNKLLTIANNLDNIHLAAELSKLFALFKDAHTMFYYPSKIVRPCVKYINKKFYYYNEVKSTCEEISQVNGYKIKDVVSKLKELICYEVDPWLYNCLTEKLTSISSLMMIDCQNKNDENTIEYTLKNGNVFTEPSLEKNTYDKEYYSFVIEKDILKIKYKVCDNMKDYPFKKFVDDIKKQCTKLPSACLIDLRNNEGGNDAIIFPLLDWLQKNNIDTYALMNGGTFSSGVFGLIDLKHRCNATLIGTDAGQAAHGYGECHWLKVGGCNFSYSHKYFNQTTIDTHQPVEEFPIKKVVNYLGPIHPDIYLEEKVEDVKAGIDGQMRDALNIINYKIKTV